MRLSVQPFGSVHEAGEHSLNCTDCVYYNPPFKECCLSEENGENSTLIMRERALYDSDVWGEGTYGVERAFERVREKEPVRGWTHFGAWMADPGPLHHPVRGWILRVSPPCWCGHPEADHNVKGRFYPSIWSSCKHQGWRGYSSDSHERVDGCDGGGRGCPSCGCDIYRPVTGAP